MRTPLLRPLLLCLTLGALVLGAASLTGCATSGDPTASWSAEKLYSEAKDALDNGDFELAISHFETLEARYPFSRHAQQAQLEIAYAYFKFGEMDSVISSIDNFLKFNPTHPHVDYAYYLRGLANFDRGASILDKVVDRDPAMVEMSSVQQAFADFTTLIKRFPNSRYLLDARQRSIYLRNVLARHELLVAEFYMKREAYVAVVNRSKYIIEHFQGTDSVIPALTTLAQAYRHLDLEDLARDTERVLALNATGATAGQRGPTGLPSGPEID